MIGEYIADLNVYHSSAQAAILLLLLSTLWCN